MFRVWINWFSCAIWEKHNNMGLHWPNFRRWGILLWNRYATLFQNGYFRTCQQVEWNLHTCWARAIRPWGYCSDHVLSIKSEWCNTCRILYNHEDKCLIWTYLGVTNGGWTSDSTIWRGTQGTNGRRSSSTKFEKLGRVCSDSGRYSPSKVGRVGTETRKGFILGSSLWGWAHTQSEKAYFQVLC